MLRSLRGPALAPLLFLACGSEPQASPAPPAAAPDRPQAAAPASAPPAAGPVPAAPAPVEPRADLDELMARLAFKPDPYGPRPGCVSEARALVKDELLLTVRFRLARVADGSLAVVDPAYQVSDSQVRPLTESQPSPGIPRLELLHADGSMLARDFRGEYAEPGDARRRTTSEEAPRDPTWVDAWFASAPIGADVVAHRVSLDGRVLSEVKRPPRPPALSRIACDDKSADGVKLRWQAHSDDARTPLLVDVLRGGPLGLVEALPLSDARQVDTITLHASPQGEQRDAVLLVSVTDTFRLVSRGVLVPKSSL